MSTTKHLINRQRRLAERERAPEATREPVAQGVREHRAEPVAGERPPELAERKRPSGSAERKRPSGPAERKRPSGPAERKRPSEPVVREESSPAAERTRLRTPLRARLPLFLAVLTVLLGAFAAYAGTRAAELRDASPARNAALADTARTSEVKGAVGKAVDALFSYDYAEPGRTDRAAAELLTGKAVDRHRELLATVKKQAAEDKLVLTTTVTDSGVELLDGDRARVLVFADQRSTRTAEKGDTTHAAAMLAVQAVHKDGRWQLADIDTFTR
ncbi:hypothetical protein ACFQVC_02195 [Streptomyces monticola]|uniref:Mce-associated membrane protein n=1 Tax=Streptomyces monticola TaxID=2666263 RepID=A0ABW2JBH0_9ACTN